MFILLLIAVILAASVALFQTRNWNRVSHKWLRRHDQQETRIQFEGVPWKWPIKK